MLRVLRVLRVSLARRDLRARQVLLVLKGPPDLEVLLASRVPSVPRVPLE